VKIVIIGGWAPSLLHFRGPLLAEIAARGHEVTAMAGDGDARTTAGLAAIGVRFEDLAIERAGLDPRADLRTLAALVRRLRSLAPDLVFTYTIKPVVWGTMAARIAGVPHRYALVTGLGYPFLGQDRLHRRALTQLVHVLYGAAVSRCEKVFFQNPDDLVDFEQRKLIPQRIPRVVVRGSGVDTAHYAVAPLPEGPPVFLFIGRMLREKGILDYIEAARRIRVRYPDVRFLLLGGPDPNPSSLSMDAVERLAAEGLIEYLGTVDDVRPVIARCSVLVLPSYREGTPRSVLEAMSMGRPIITSDAAGCRQTTSHGESGFLVPLQDPGAVAAAMERFILDPSLVATMGRRGRARAEELYDVHRVNAVVLAEMGL
jgi:glycosyltransferase involved in cell wall biosynthesis